MENPKNRRLWASLTMVGLIFSQLTTGVFPIPISPTDAAYAAGFFIEKERIDAPASEPVAAGDTIRYEITIRNNDTKEANARIIDPVPPELTFESATNSCYYESYTDEVICAQQPLAVGATRTERITFRVKNSVQECTTIENQADVWNDDANPPSGIAPSWSNVVETPVECPNPELEITKTQNKTDLEPGEQIRYTLRVENVGDGTAQNVEVTDQIPSGLIYDSNASSNLCSSNGSTVTCDAGNLNHGGSKSFNLYFNVDNTIQPSDSRCGNDITNQARADADNADQVLSNSVSAHLTCPAPELEITKTANKNALQPGDQIRYTLTGKNVGTGIANSVRILDQIPNGLVFDSGASDSRCSQVANRIECDLSTLTVNQTKSLNIYFDVDPNIQAGHSLCGTNIVNIGQITAANAVTQSSLSVVTPLNCPAPALSLTKSVDTATAEPGDRVTYALQVTNSGNARAEDIVVTDTIPAGLTFNEGASSAACNGNGTTVTCGPFDLDANRDHTFNLKFDVNNTAPCGGTIHNTASAVALNHGNITSNQVSFAVECPAPQLRVTKTARHPTRQLGEQIKFTVAIFNDGTGDATGVTFTDTVPSGLTFRSDLTTNECQLNGNTITCGTYTIAGGASKYVELFFEVEDTAPCNGTITNRATVHASNHANVTSNDASIEILCPKLDIQKTGPSTVVAGNDVTYTFTVQNIGNAVAPNVTGHDFFIHNITQNFINAPFIFKSSGGGVSCSENNDIWKCNLGDLQPGQTKTFTLTFTVPDNVPALCGTVVMNQADAHILNGTGTPASDWDKHQLTVTCVQGEAELELTKSANKTTAKHLDIVTYTLNVKNVGTITAEDVAVVDPLPSHLMYLDGQSDSSCDLQGNNVVCDGFDLAPGQDKDIEIAFKVLDTAPCNGTIPNRGDAYADNAPTVWSNQVNLSILCDVPGFTAVKSVDKTQVEVGGTLTYTIALENTGNTQLSGTWVIDKIPANLTFNAGASDSRCFKQGGDVKCGDDAINVGQNDSYQLVFTVANTAQCGNVIANNAYVVFIGNGGLDGTTNTVNTTVICPDTTIQLTKVADKTTADKLESVTYTLNVKNTGTVTADNVVVVDPTPDYMMYLGGISDSRCTIVGVNIECNIGDLAPGADEDIELVFKVLDGALCGATIANQGEGRADNAPAVWSNQVNVSVTCDDPSLSMVKTVDKTTIEPLDIVTYTFVVTNNGNGNATGVKVVDPISPYYMYLDGQSDALCSKVNNTVECGTFTLAPGQSRTIQVAFKLLDTNPPCGDIIRNTADGIADGNILFWSNTATVNVTCGAPHLAVTKTANKQQVSVGDRVSYTLNVQNTGTATANNVFVIDDVIPELTFVPAQSTPTCSVTAGSIECGPVNLLAGANQTFIVTFEVSAAAQCDSTIYNQVEAVADNADPALSNSEDIDVICDDPEADLKVIKTGASQIMRGTTIIYDVTVTNLGPDTAEDVLIYDTIPQVLKQDTTSYLNLEFNPFQSDGTCFESAGEVVCGGQDLANGQSKTFKLAFDVPANAFCAKPILNHVETESSTVDPISGNNSANHYSTVNCATGTLDIHKSGPATARHGDEITYTIVVQNNLGFNVTRNRVIDPVPTHLQFVRANDNLCSYQSYTNEVICGEFDINSGASRTFELTFKVLNTAACNRDIVNIADIWSNHGNVNPQWSNAVNTKILCDATLEIEKTDNRTTARPGDTLTYEIDVRNVSQADAIDAIIVDELPDEVTFVSANASGTYDSNSHKVFWTLNVNAGDTETLTVTVQVTGAQNGDVLYNEACVKNTYICDDDTTTIVEDQPEFRITKTDNRTTARRGDQLTYDIQVTNISSTSASNVQITDDLPNDVTFVSASDNGVHSNGTVTWSKNIAAGQTVTVHVTVEVDDTAQNNQVLYNQACLKNTTVCDDDTTTIVVDQDPVLTISKTDHRSTVEPGEQLTYDIEISNISATDADNVDIIDTLPSFVSFVSASDNGSFSNGDVRWTKDIAAGQTITLHVTVEVDANAPDGTYLLNFVEIVGGPNDDDVTRVIVNQEYGCIDVKKETFNKNGDVLTPVTQFTFFLDGNVQTVQNDSNGNARFLNVPVGLHTVTETIPSGWEQVNVTPANGQVNVHESNNCVTVTFKNQQKGTTTGRTDFTITKTDNETEVAPGDRLTYEITVTNVGTTDETDVEVVDDLPNNVDYVSASDGGRRSGSRVTWTIDLDAGESKTLTLKVDVDDNADDGDRIDNEACVENYDCDDDRTTVVTDDDDDDNNDDDVTISVNDDPDPVDACDEDLEYEIRLSNSSNENQEVDVIALLDGNTDYRSSSDGGRERSGDRVEWDNVRISRNSSKTLRLRVNLDSDIRDGDTLRLRAAISNGDEDTEITRVRNRDCGYNPPNGTPELSIDKTADRTEALAGSIASYTITVRNIGNEDIPNATLTDDYPESYITISDPGGGSDAGGMLRWDLGTLRANSTTVVRYRVRLKDGLANGTRIHNIATVRGGALTRTDDHTIIVPTPPQTGLGGFIKGITQSDSYTTVAVKPQAREVETIIDAQAATSAATLPVMVWVTTMMTGLGLGGFFGRRFLL